MRHWTDVLSHDTRAAAAGTVAYIPARLNSERVPQKNLRQLGADPLITYVARTAQRASLIDRVYVNTESPRIAAVARTTGADIYMRAPSLAAASVTTDEILYDFAKSIDCRTLVVINPTAPFLTAETIDLVVSAFRGAAANATLFTTTRLRKHLVLDGRPYNFNAVGRSPRTQDLNAFEYINFIIFVISRAKVVGEYEQKGHCLWTPPLAFYPMSGLECHDIDEEIDFRFAEAMLARIATADDVRGPGQRSAGRDFGVV